MVYQPKIRLLIGISFYRREGVVDGVEDASKSDVVRWQSEDVMMEPMVMKEIQCVIEG